MNQLKKTLNLFSGTILFLNIVIGAGLLVIPGLAYQRIGNLALISWLICVLVTLPLISIFILLGRNYPNAGGISYYGLKAFGNYMQRICSFLILGAVVLGLPSIAMTGGYYLNAILPFSSHLYSALFIFFAAVLHLFKIDSITKILGWIGSSVIIVLLVLLAISFFGININTNTQPQEYLLNSSNFSLLFAPFMMIFFAFTGWEIGSHAAEEFKDTRRDFPLAMILSYIIASILYLLIAWIVQKASIHESFTSPFIEIIYPVLGKYGTYVVAIVAALLIFANLFGAIWGISRLVYSLARDNILPRVLASTNNSTPIHAVFTVMLSLELVILLDYLKIINVEAMLSLAGQNFLILYGIAAASLFQLSKNIWIKILSIAVVTLVIILIYNVGLHLIYPIILITISFLIKILSKPKSNE